MMIGASGVVVLEPGIPGDHTLYDGEVTVKFDPTIHEYQVKDIAVSPDWRVVPSVTTVLSLIDKSKALVPWAARCCQNKFLELVQPGTAYTQEQLETFSYQIKDASKEQLEHAGRIGHETHEWIQNYLMAHSGNGLFPASPVDEHVRSCCRGAREWIKQAGIRPFAIERILYSRKHQVVGTTDLAAALIVGGRTAICDWKSSNRLHDSYKLQLAAYRSIYAEMTNVFLDDRWLIRLDKNDSTFDPVCLPQEEADRDSESFFALAHAFTLLQSADLIS